jgi:hypothetical protein
MHTIKVVGCNAELTNPEGSSTKFTDLHQLIKHIKDRNIQIQNPQQLPDFFKKQLN